MEVFERPAETYVAGFIGAPAMNFLPANAGARRYARPRLETGLLLPLADGRRGLPDGHPVTVGIRPEHLSIAAEGLELVVDLVEPLGSETVVHGRLAVRRDAGREAEWCGPGGERMTVRPDPAQLHLFERETGTRIQAPSEQHAGAIPPLVVAT